MENTPIIIPEINPEAGKPGETINITVHASPDTQSVVAIIGTQRINLTFTNGTGIWTTNYTIPLDSTFDIHTIRIEGTDMVGNAGPNPRPEPNPGLNPGPMPGPEPEPTPHPLKQPTNTVTT
jgi:hypothetical protein